MPFDRPCGDNGHPARHELYSQAGSAPPGRPAAFTRPGRHAAALLLLGAVGIFATVGAFATYYQYSREVRSYDNAVGDMLQVKAWSDAAAAAAWRRERAAEAWFAAHELQQRRSGAGTADRPDVRSRQVPDLIDWLAGLGRLPDRQAVAFFDRQLTAISATAGFPATLDAGGRAALEDAARSRRVVFSAVHREAPTDAPHIDVVAPVPPDGAGAPDGFLVFRVDLAASLLPILGGWPIVSRTGRCLLMVRDGRRFVSADQTRAGDGSAVILQRAGSDHSRPEQVFEATSERGGQILAAAAPVPDTPWFVVATIDRADIEAAIRQRGWLLALSFGGLVAAGAMVAFVFVWRAQAASYKRQYEQEAARARTEDALRDTEQTLRSLLDYAPMPIYVASPPGRFVAVNAAWEAVTGISRPVALAEPYSKIFPPESAREFEESDRRALNGGQPVRTEQSVVVRGERRYFDTVKFPIRDHAGRITAVGGISVDFTQHKKSAERLRMVAARLSEIEDRERSRLARELHDQVGQNLTALGVSLSLASLDLEQGTASAVCERLAAAQDLLAETGKSIRNVLLDLRPPALDDQGLIAALQGATGRLAATTGLRVVVEGAEPSPRMDPGVAAVLYRIAQEALTNAVRHAQARTLVVTVSQTDKTVRMTVNDDGRGFDVAARPLQAERPSWGLLIMEERARAIGALVRIESAPNSGTRVIVEVPR